MKVFVIVRWRHWWNSVNRSTPWRPSFYILTSYHDNIYMFSSWSMWWDICVWVKHMDIMLCVGETRSYLRTVRKVSSGTWRHRGQFISEEYKTSRVKREQNVTLELSGIQYGTGLPPHVRSCGQFTTRPHVRCDISQNYGTQWGRWNLQNELRMWHSSIVFRK
jgi:hypothetical protein